MPDNPTQTDTPGATLLNAARDLAARGYAVHPLRPGGKAALVPKWQELATTDPEQIRKWWDRWPDANIGLVAGLSNHLFVDCDRHAEGQDGVAAFAVWAEANDVDLTSVPCVLTPRDGRHYHFRLPAGADVGNGVDAIPGLPGVDIRAGNKYVVAPPSWSQEYDAPWAWTLAPADDVERAEAPAAVLELISRFAKRDVMPAAAPANAPSAILDYDDGESADPTPARYQQILQELSLVEEPGRNHTLNKKAHAIGRCYVAPGRVARAVAERDLTDVARRLRGASPLSPDEIAATIRSGLDDGVAAGLTAAGKAGPALSGIVGPDGKRFNLTEFGNAEFFAALHEADVRYDHRHKRWLVSNGHTWSVDDDGALTRLVIECIRARGMEAMAIKDSDERKKAIAWALKSESVRIANATLDAAKDLHPIASNGEGWDPDPHLLGFRNGVVDLRTRELRPGRPKDRITRVVACPYDPNAEAPRWTRFVEEIFPDEELRAWIHLAAGYSITGDVSERCFFFCYGETGWNGKSKFIGAIRNVLRDYGQAVPFKLFLKQRGDGGGEGASPFLADLDGIRFVTASEPAQFGSFDEARIKELTGEDIIRVRKNYGNPFSLAVRFHIWLSANHKPKVADTSDAFWGRARFIPFTQSFSGDRADPLLEQTLAAETPGILRWLVDGAATWYEARANAGDRLVLENIPGSEDLVREWRTENDSVQEFINERCVEDWTADVDNGVLNAAYLEWCRENGIRRHMSRKDLIAHLHKTYADKIIHGKHFLRGLRLLSSQILDSSY